MATKVDEGSPVHEVEKDTSQHDSGSASLAREDVDHDKVYSYQEQRRIIRRM
jgi:hypothetical protein